MIEKYVVYDSTREASCVDSDEITGLYVVHAYDLLQHAQKKIRDIYEYKIAKVTVKVEKL